MRTPDNAVAVAGVALRVPGAADPDTFWDQLLHGAVALPGPQDDGTLGVGRIDRVAEFDAELFGLTPTQAAVTDPQQRVITEVAWQALEDAGIDTERTPGRVGVFLGCGDSGYRHRYVGADPVLSRAAGRQQISLGNDKDFLATSLAFRLGLTGPALTVQTACSTSLVAVHTAIRSLLTFECDIALAGGVTVQLPVGEGYTYRKGDVLSPDGRCRPFTEGSRGTVPASGAGVVVLRRAGEAGPGTRALLLGSALNNDGADRMSLVAPSPKGQAAVIEEALQLAGLKPDDIGFVETHGTATELGDQVELSALAEVYGHGSTSCALGAVKANIGHTDTAAGVIGLIKAVLAVQHGTIPPTPSQPGDGPTAPLGADRFRVPRQPDSWETGRPRYAAVSSFGLGGTNAHVVLAEPPRPADDSVPAPALWSGRGLAVLSASGPEALTRTAARLGAELRAGTQPSSEVLGTLWHGRHHLAHRWTHLVEAADEATARRQLADGLDSAASARPAVPEPSVAVVLPGQGVPLAGTGRGLLAADPEFARTWASLRSLVRERGGPDLEGCWDWPDDDPRWLRTDIVQPLLFTVELALLHGLRQHGITPGVLLGHSVGELVAATWAGVFSEADGAAAVVARGRLMSQAPSGVMTAVLTGEDAVRELTADLSVDVCAVNAPDVLVLGGEEQHITEAEHRCAEARMKTRRLLTAHAFHSRSMAEAAEAFTTMIGTLRLDAPRTTVLSNLTGRPLDAAQATDPAYWGRQLAGTVRFAEAMETLLGGDPHLVLEAGPGRTFTAQLRRATRGADNRPLLAELLGDGTRDEASVHLAALGTAWTAGCTTGDLAPAPRTGLRIPGHAFADTPYWASIPDIPQPASADPGTPAAPAPPEETEDLLAALWQESFGGPAIRPDDNFFELGGTSLQAAQLVTVVNDQLLVDVHLQDLYEHSTFRDFAARVKALLDERDDAQLLALLAEIEAEGQEGPQA
ncbi:acyltransferase domain-containing protein [Streptomyces hirsutus]|uniref:type I polyketide synthase n=1 Tax=Streptomyces hirsutus TaxID=35620 RepID=UPI003869B99D|nr:acyltransferase domain-containing protein [Streptomyces hirsutus]